MRPIILVICGGVLLAVVGYVFWPDSGPQIHVSPLGEIEADGALTGTGISLVRRGTHVFHTEKGDIYFVESNKVNLQEYEGRRVTITGTASANTAPKYYPILVVETVSSQDMEEYKESQIPSLGITLSVPTLWSSTVQNGVFSLHAAGEEDPVVTIRRIPHSEEEYKGQSVRVSGHAGVRVNGEDGAQTMYVNDTTTILVIAFVPPDEERLDEYGQIFAKLLSSLSFSAETASFSSVATGSGTGLPCGGPAGVLCPAGFFCDITDLTLNTGACRATRSQ